MKFWLSKNSEVPVRVQLFEQIVLGIASGDLKPEEKLPSTRELARRFNIHQNTVSAAYRRLTEEGYIQNRKGSGVFVASDGADTTERPRLDDLFSDFVRRAEFAGYSSGEIETHITNTLARKLPQSVLVVESDAPLREIIVNEIRDLTGLKIEGVSFETFAAQPIAKNALIAAMADERTKLQPILPEGSPCVFLNANSVSASLDGRERPKRDELVAVVSGWERFLSLAQVYLVAARIEPEMIITRSTQSRNWRAAVRHARLIICDAVTAKRFSGDDRRVQTFPLVSTASLEEVRKATGASDLTANKPRNPNRR